MSIMGGVGLKVTRGSWRVRIHKTIDGFHLTVKPHLQGNNQTTTWMICAEIPICHESFDVTLWLEYKETCLSAEAGVAHITGRRHDHD